jgi:hypothetical protein
VAQRWDCGLDLVGNSSTVTLSATDIASEVVCGRHLALKVRKATLADWGRRFGPWGVKPFPLGIIRDIVRNLHSRSAEPSPAELTRTVTAALSDAKAHRLVHPFVRHAVDNVLDAHREIEDDLGRLRFVRADPVFPGDPNAERKLTAWALLYATEDGRVNEIRRFRFGAAQPPDENGDDPDRHWHTTAAYLAAVLDPAADRVRAVEIGCLDGSVTVGFDGTPGLAIDTYKTRTRPRAAEIIGLNTVSPCSRCGDCKAAGVCDALIPMPGMLGPTAPGLESRSVSPTELETYRRCPGQWLLHSELRLPTTPESSSHLRRGHLVHLWLETAHQRGIACTAADLPAPGDGGGLTGGLIEPDDLELVRGYLEQHIAACPLRDPAVTDIAVETSFRGFDATAQLVPVMRPDMIYRRGGALVLRETKTAAATTISTPEDAFARYFQIPFSIQMLRHGLLAQHDADAGIVELELLTPEERRLWTWATDDPDIAAAAATATRDAVLQWHDDSRWTTTPGPHCAWCPVRRWCPDRDATDRLGR